MEANNALPPQGTQGCILCNRLFRPHPKAQTRQRVCDDEQCQRLRQKLNQLDWMERHPVDYKIWYQDYGKAWRQKNPHYQKQYRQRKKNQQSLKHQPASTQLILQALLHTYQSEKKEQLTVTNTASTSKKFNEKEEQLTNSFYLLKAKDLVLWPLDDEKKEQLAYCFN